MVNQEYYNLGTAPSVIRALFAYGLEQAAKVGADKVYDYSIGNPSIPAPKKVNESIVKIVNEVDSIALHGYSMAAGFEPARKAVADDLSARFGLDVKSSELFFTCGAAPALISIIKALTVNADSEIMAIAPFFPEYRPFVEFNGSKFVIIPADQDKFQIDFAAMEEGLTKNTQAVIVNSPNNPSGSVYTRETLTKLADLLTRKSEEYGHPIYVIADEPYRELVYDDAYVHYIPDIYPNTIICYSYSKVFSLPGERIGYFFIPDCVEDGERLYYAASGAARVNGHVCAPSLQQKVIQICADVKPDISVYDRNRVVLYDALTNYGYQCVKPQGAFYLFVKAPYGTAKEFSDRAKLDNLLIVPGDEFGCPEYFRASICVSYDMIIRSLPIFKKLIEEKPE